MADLNELLEQATAQADGLAGEAARAQQSVDRVLRLAASVSDGIEAGGAEARRVLEVLSTRLLEGEQDLVRENGTALGALAGLRSAAAEVQGRVGRYLTLVHAQLAELRTEKDRVREQVQQQAEAAEGHVTRYAEHVKDVEVASRARLDAARQAVGSLRGLVEASRGAVYERREALGSALKQLEAAGRQRVEYMVQAYDALAATVQDQIGELQATLGTLTDQGIGGLARRLGRDTLESLRAAAEPLRDAIAELERFCEESRQGSGEQMDEITGHIEDVTGVLERLRQPLDHIRQHLH